MKPTLRYTLVAAGFVLSTAPAISQEIISVQVTEASCDTLHAQISVFFPFGAPGTCPEFVGSTIMPGGATALLSLFYDVSGPWPDLGCGSTITVSIPIPSGEVMVNLVTYNIADGDTSGVVSDALVNVCMTGTAEVAGAEPVMRLQSGSLTWEIPLEHAQETIRIISGNGQLVRSCPVSAGSCPINDLRLGVYSAWWPGRGALRFVQDRTRY